MAKRRATKKKEDAPVKAVRARAPRKEPATNNDDFTFEEPKARTPMQWVEVQCPYCGEKLDIRVDPSEEGQVLVQDCQVCCKPVEMAVDVEDGEISVHATRG